MTYNAVNQFIRSIAALLLSVCVIQGAWAQFFFTGPGFLPDENGTNLDDPQASKPVDPVTQYFVQVGAFYTLKDAESHRAKLLLSGIKTQISERAIPGPMVYRVRVGPFEKLEEGQRTKDKLDKVGLETALVRVQN